MSCKSRHFEQTTFQRFGSCILVGKSIFFSILTKWRPLSSCWKRCVWLAFTFKYKESPQPVAATATLETSATLGTTNDTWLHVALVRPVLNVRHEANHVRLRYDRISNSLICVGDFPWRKFKGRFIFDVLNSEQTVHSSPIQEASHWHYLLSSYLSSSFCKNSPVAYPSSSVCSLFLCN